MLKQWILLLLLNFTLSACLNDEDKDSRVQLPNINPNLSTESPEGIWLLHMDIEATESYPLLDNSEAVSHDRYFIRQVVKIEQGENPSEVKQGANCSHSHLPTHTSPAHLNLFSGYSGLSFHVLSESSAYNPNYKFQVTNISNTDLPNQWNLQNNILSPILINNPSLQTGEHTPLICAFGCIGSPFHFPPNKEGIKSGELKLNNNLSISGRLEYRNNTYNSDEFNYFRRMSIKGVKLSDATVFLEAAEIDFQMQLNQADIDEDNSSPLLSCLRTANWQSKLIIKNSEEQKQIRDSHELLTVKFESSAYLQIDNDLLDKEKKVEHDLSLYPNTYTPMGGNQLTNLCSISAPSTCQSAIRFNQEINYKNKNGFSSQTSIVNDDGEVLEANVLFSVKP